MGRETVLFKSEERKNSQGAADFLRQLADRVEQREVTLQQNGNELHLSLPSEIKLEIKVEEEASKGGVKRSLEVEIEWQEGGPSRGTVKLA